ncbi:phosphohistidine phosphatase SixA [candidate division TA06 bacterium]|uniref:phosphoglycerate mutase (2,3-diphosphoglycerate-dependent) n=1 Tax=candidate division TA06 bacterium TaxID=2250710 RepID=A0A933IB59_UNCT6|nr:phosphohistidine phosphatase SixA [candidate division TA06 bacterium]
MELYILRHGLAGESGDPRYPDDSQRPLTAEGKRKMHQAALGIKAMGITFDLVFTSPYLRARQTAEIVCKQLDCAGGLQITENLEPGRDPRRLISEINEHNLKNKSVLITGHEPFLSGLVSFLISGSHSPQIELKKGALCKLEVNDLKYSRCAALLWLLTSKQLGMMSRP